MDRRSLVKHVGMAGVLAAGVAPSVHAQETMQWRLVTSFPKSLDAIHGAAEKFAQTLKLISGGQIDVVVQSAGESLPAFGVMEGVQSGVVEMALTAPYYFTDKDPTFAFGCAVPFGLTARQMDAWMEYGGGRKLMDDFYGQYNIKSLSAGNTGAQMGGWYRKEIKAVADLKGLGLWERVCDDLLRVQGDLSRVDGVPESLQATYRTSFQVDPQAYLQVAARAQKWIDQAISRNIYLADRSVTAMVDLYQLAWRMGLKTTYYLHMMPRHQAEQSTVKVNKAAEITGAGAGPRRGFGARSAAPVVTGVQVVPKASIGLEIDGVECPVDPQERLQCESCQ